MIVWHEEFPSVYRVPLEIVKLVESGVVEDMSWRQDPAPSFGRKLKNKNWVRLWVEHPDPVQRIGWDRRYTVIVQPDPSIPFGWKMVATDDIYEALTWLTGIVKLRNPGFRFQIKRA